MEQICGKFTASAQNNVHLTLQSDWKDVKSRWTKPFYGSIAMTTICRFNLTLATLSPSLSQKVQNNKMKKITFLKYLPDKLF
jgi:hypothetical protein